LSIATAKQDLLASFKEQAFREAFNLENVYTTICFQLRALREQRNMTQGKLGKAAHMAPERISILEDPNAESKPTLKTLLRLASALDVGLDVRFVSFSEVLTHSVHTDMGELEVPSFMDELSSMEAAIEFESELEQMEASVNGVTRASNNIFVLPHPLEDEAGQTSNPSGVVVREEVETLAPNIIVEEVMVEAQNMTRDAVTANQNFNAIGLAGAA
jgi:transcriptional regulator with XRE-family HTH domain